MEGKGIMQYFIVIIFWSIFWRWPDYSRRPAEDEEPEGQQKTKRQKTKMKQGGPKFKWNGVVWRLKSAGLQSDQNALFHLSEMASFSIDCRGQTTAGDPDAFLS